MGIDAETLTLLELIQAAAFEVRKHLSEGFLEDVYKKALVIELANRGINARREVPLSVMYKGCNVGSYFADILVEDKIIIEVKAVRSIVIAHEQQLVNYLSATGMDVGLLINFGGEKFFCKKKYRVYSPPIFNSQS